MYDGPAGCARATPGDSLLVAEKSSNRCDAPVISSAMLARAGVARQASGRGLVLLPAGAFLVHQLRYWLTYGSSASSQLADQGHAYLGALVPWVVLAAAAGLGGFVARVAAARGGAGDTARPPFLRVWGIASCTLLAIYTLQELLEGVLAHGHPGGFAGVFGHGGWWSVPAAVGIGLAIAALLRAASTLVRLAARRARVTLRPQGAPRLVPATLPARTRPLASAAAGRAPPLLLRAA